MRWSPPCGDDEVSKERFQVLKLSLLLAGTVVYSGHLLGEDLTSPPEYRKVDILPTGKECRELGTSRFQMVPAGEGIWQLRTLRGRPAGWLINSRPYAGDVSGFGGPTPVWIYLNADNQVERILPGENSETAMFFERALNGGILERWRGVAAARECRARWCCKPSPPKITFCAMP